MLSIGLLFKPNKKATLLSLVCALVGIFILVKVNRAVTDKIDQKTATLNFLLDKNQVSLKDQIAFSHSEINKVREALAAHESTDLTVLNSMTEDSARNVKTKAYTSLQKRNEIPMMDFKNYFSLADQDNLIISFSIGVMGALIFFSINRRKNLLVTITSGLAFILSISTTAGLARNSVDFFYAQRSQIIAAKLENNSLTEKELSSVLESFTQEDSNAFAANVDKISNNQLLLIYPNSRSQELENEMKRRNLITEHSIKPEDLQ